MDDQTDGDIIIVTLTTTVCRAFTAAFLSNSANAARIC